MQNIFAKAFWKGGWPAEPLLLGAVAASLKVNPKPTGKGRAGAERLFRAKADRKKALRRMGEALQKSGSNACVLNVADLYALFPEDILLIRREGAAGLKKLISSETDEGRPPMQRELTRTRESAQELPQPTHHTQKTRREQERSARPENTGKSEKVDIRAFWAAAKEFSDYRIGYFRRDTLREELDLLRREPDKAEKRPQENPTPLLVWDEATDKVEKLKEVAPVYAQEKAATRKREEEPLDLSMDDKRARAILNIGMALQNDLPMRKADLKALHWKDLDAVARYGDGAMIKLTASARRFLERREYEQEQDCGRCRTLER